MHIDNVPPVILTVHCAAILPANNDIININAKVNFFIFISFLIFFPGSSFDFINQIVFPLISGLVSLPLHVFDSNPCNKSRIAE